MRTGTCNTTAADSIRILLSESASKHLLEAGSFFAVIQRGSYPSHDGNRMVIHLIPCDYQQAVDAVAVATGEAKASRPRVKAAPEPAEGTSAM